MVVFGHALSYQIGSPAERTYLGIAIWSVHMQLFAFVSGLVTRGVAQNPGGFVLRRARQLLVPYFCWTAIAGLVAEVSLRSVLDAERVAVFFPRTSLWFLYTLFLCCLILAAIAPFGSRVVLAAALLLPLARFLPIRMDVMGLWDLLVLFPYFAIGYLAGQHRPRLDRVRLVPVVACAVTYLGVYWLLATPGVPSAPAWFLAVRQQVHWLVAFAAAGLLTYLSYVWGAAGVAFIYLISPAIKGRIEALLALVGRNSLGIYAMQAMALQWIARSGIRAAVPMTVLALFVTTLATIGLARVPVARELLLGAAWRRRDQDRSLPQAPATPGEAQ